jgi:S-adenosylmethionine:tRNA ribosyltransferase-isomerase
MDVSAFDYPLPPSAIAQVPLEPRHAARLLIDGGPEAETRHGHIPDLIGLVGTGDVVVVNTTRVLPARLSLVKPTGGAVEVLLLEPADGAPVASAQRWEALVRPSRKVPGGTSLRAGADLAVVVGDDLGEGRRSVELMVGPGIGVLDALERHGTVPLPPYITTALDDPERYQTTYAERAASVAAPTAGLHLTPDVLAAVRATGAEIHTVELVVGLGTFRPIGVERVEDHQMHAEAYRVPEATLAACEAADRVLAVGTTTVRALESAAASGCLAGRTDLFIQGPHPFQVIDLLLTNFHQPRSSLLVLVDAFVGPRWRGLYEEALSAGYRFLSFGDAMLLRRERG